MRVDDITLFVEGDRIWPPNWRAYLEAQFLPALKEALTRLDEEAFDYVQESVSIILDTGGMRGLNVPMSLTVPSGDHPYTIQRNCIVLFHQSWKLSHGALVGLLAHEMAHSFIECRDHEDNEIAADELVRKWGLGSELDQLRSSGI